MTASTDRHPSAPVFLDHSGRRWRRASRMLLGVGIATTVLLLALIASALVPPRLPAVTLGGPGSAHPPLLARLAGRGAVQRRLAREKLLHAIHQARRTARARALDRPAPVRDSLAPIVAGFYVNWDDNSLASYRAHAAQMDWVVGEWAFFAPKGDSLAIDVDPRLLRVTDSLPPAQRPRVLAMVSNFDQQSGRFDPRRVSALIGTPAARARMVRQLLDAVHRYDLGGIVIDLENLGAVDPNLLALDRTLHDSLGAEGRVLAQTLPVFADSSSLATWARVTDKLVIMLYDQHYGAGDAGPVAGQDWYEQTAQRVLDALPPGKGILAVGAYGYDWNDAGPRASGEAMTFQDVMAAVRDHGIAVQFDSASLNPYAVYTDADSTDHVVWFLDGATAYNEMRAGEALNAGGIAVWRLGSEDPSLWRAVPDAEARRAGARLAEDPAPLRVLPPGYDVEIRGEGEVLRVARKPTVGARTFETDSVSGDIVHETIDETPSPYVVQRSGASAHRVALTFDDGPDSRWTPYILDTLRSRGARGTFFVVGQAAETDLPLLRRIVADGNEIGNHTFTHPNLARVSPFVQRLEIDANERLLEAALDRRPLFFRPPYFGDAEPTTADELVPVGIASDLGYLTVGVHDDPMDWNAGITADQIVRNALAERSRGNIILLHDSGGDRSATVAALGTLIDSLRARGDTLVPVSALAGVTRDVALAPLPATSEFTRRVLFASYAAVGGVRLALRWILLLAVVLGGTRLLLLTGLALWQRLRRLAAPDAGFAPSVSVIVPAYKEEKVIVSTVASLLRQDYAGPLEIVVVDDGSPDATFAVAQAAFGTHPRVRVLHKTNGGKASALDYGIAQAAGEIVVCLDADTIFATDTVRRLVAPLANPKVGAVAGNAKVGNRVNVVTRLQALEYITSQNLDRRAFAALDCITIVPGAVGAWRKSAVLEARGFSDATLAEDQDLTISLRRRGWSIAYAEDAVAWTEAPDTMQALARQRFRWSFGTLQCAWRHRDTFLRPRYGTLGWIAMPNVWIFGLVFAALAPLADLAFLMSVLGLWWERVQHGGTYALAGLEHVVSLYAVFLVVDWCTAALGLLMEQGEERSLLWFVALQRVLYRQLMYWVVLKSIAAAVRGRVVGWGKLERKATVELPPSDGPEAEAA